ncbi:hypothetical protein D3C80_1956180 [compost metagenome]
MFPYKLNIQYIRYMFQSRFLYNSNTQNSLHNLQNMYQNNLYNLNNHYSYHCMYQNIQNIQHMYQNNYLYNLNIQHMCPYMFQSIHYNY